MTNIDKMKQSAADEVGERPGPAASLAESIGSDNLDDVIDYGNGNDSADDEVFRRQMRATAKVKRE